MTNAEWKELVAKEFGVSKSVARDMVSAMYSVYRRKKGKMKLIGFGLDDLADRYEATPYDPRYTTKYVKMVGIRTGTGHGHPIEQALVRRAVFLTEMHHHILLLELDEKGQVLHVRRIRLRTDIFTDVEVGYSAQLLAYLQAFATHDGHALQATEFGIVEQVEQHGGVTFFGYLFA